MFNALLFLGIALVDLILILIAWRLGKEYLIATMFANIILTFIFSGQLIPIFGLVTTTGEVFYAAIFIATDILSEHHGKKVAYHSIFMGFLALFMLVVFSQLAIQFIPAIEVAQLAEALRNVFNIVPRIAIAGFTAYIVAQTFDIWFFHRIKNKTGVRMLWLRNNLSTMTSLVIDSLVFVPLAFFGTVSMETLGILVLTGWLFKAPVAILDTPFMYLSYIVVGKSPPDFGKFRHLKHESPATAL